MGGIFTGNAYYTVQALNRDLAEIPSSITHSLPQAVTYLSLTQLAMQRRILRVTAIMEKSNGTILAIRCPWQRQRRFAVAFAAVTLFLLVFSISKPSLFTRGLYTPSQSVYGTTTKSLVPLEAHIMSKCPDARVIIPSFL